MTPILRCAQDDCGGGDHSEEPVRKEETSLVRAGEAARELIRCTRQATRRKYPAEETIRILVEGIRGEGAVSELCRREGTHPTIYYKWLKDFKETDKGRLRTAGTGAGRT